MVSISNEHHQNELNDQGLGIATGGNYGPVGAEHFVYGDTIQNLERALTDANALTLKMINDLLRGDLEGHDANPHSGREQAVCHEEKSCGNAASCMIQHAINPAIMYGSSLLRDAGHCISIPHLLEELFQVIDVKG